MTDSAKYDRIIRIAILLLGAVFLIVGFNYDFNMYDEGIGLYGAERIASGDIPYRDFWTIYSPGLFYLIAGVSTVFGWSIITGRILTLVMVYMLAYFCALIAERLSSKRLSLIPFSIVIVFYGAIPQSSRAIIPTLLIFAISLFFLLNFIETRNNNRAIFAGLTNGLVFFFRYDFGIYLLIAAILTLIFIRYQAESDNMKMKGLNSFKPTLFYFLSFLTFVLIPFGYFFLNVPINDLTEQLYIVPAHIFPAVRSLHVPLPFRTIGPAGSDFSISRILITFWETFCFYTPFLIYTLGIITVFFKKNTPDKKKLISLLFLSVCGIMLYGQASVRSDVEHAIPTIIFSSVVLVYFLSDLKGRLFFLGIIVLILVFSLPFYKKYQIIKSVYNSSTGLVKINRAWGITAPCDWKTENEQAVNYIQKVTAKNEKIFVGNSRHDRLMLNNAMFYFLSERQSCTKYHELHPGVATTFEVQKRIIEDIKFNKVSYIVLFAEKFFPEPNQSGVSSGVYLLDNYIQLNFSKEKEFGRYSILKRNGINPVR